jgi:hypothetical protein
MTERRVCRACLLLAAVVLVCILLRTPAKAARPSPSHAERRQVCALVRRDQLEWLRWSVANRDWYVVWRTLRRACARLRCTGVYDLPSPHLFWVRYANVSAIDPFDRKMRWDYDLRLLTNGVWRVEGIAYHDRSVHL